MYIIYKYKCNHHHHHHHPTQLSQIFQVMIPLLGKIWSLTSNYAIYRIVIVVVGDNDDDEHDKNKFHIRNRDIARTPALGTSIGGRGLSGDDGLSSKDKDVYGEITKIIQKRDTISYLADSYSESYTESFILRNDEGVSPEKLPIPEIGTSVGITTLSHIKSFACNNKSFYQNETSSTKPIPIVIRR